jgi:uncharacterized protein YjiS (DUF1127 family)
MSLINLIAAIRKAFPESLREQAYVDLLALDDHSLADIGLRRSDILAGLCRGTNAVDVMPEPQIARRQRPVLAHRSF